MILFSLARCVLRAFVVCVCVNLCAYVYVSLCVWAWEGRHFSCRVSRVAALKKNSSSQCLPFPVCIRLCLWESSSIWSSVRAFYSFSCRLGLERTASRVTSANHNDNNINHNNKNNINNHNNVNHNNNINHNNSINHNNNINNVNINVNNNNINNSINGLFSPPIDRHQDHRFSRPSPLTIESQKGRRKTKRERMERFEEKKNHELPSGS